MTGIDRLLAAFGSGSDRSTIRQGHTGSPANSRPSGTAPRSDVLPLLMTHAVCGYPDLATSERLMLAMLESGSDMLEAQIPFSDPSADGPAIVAANHAALASGATTAACLDMLGRVRSRTGKPILVMSYLNPLLAFGIRRLADFISATGLDGAIVPDCPGDEPEYRLPDIMRGAGLAFVPLVAPSTSLERARQLALAASSPFVYAVLRLGVTGRATVVTDEARRRLVDLREATGRYVAAGFGLGERSQLEDLAGCADCAIVGSAALGVFDRAARAGHDGVEAVGRFVAGLVAAGHGAAGNGTAGNGTAGNGAAGHGTAGHDA